MAAKMVDPTACAMGFTNDDISTFGSAWFQNGPYGIETAADRPM
jgi:hypothetical protein